MMSAFDFRRLRKILAAAAVGAGILQGAVALAAEPTGASTYKTIYSFGAAVTDGVIPRAALIVDARGHLYGTTQLGGGESKGCYAGSCGVVFELTPPATAGGPWTKKVLHRFSGVDGAAPTSSLIIDAKGNLYGTTNLGGNLLCNDSGFGCGTVFELSPPTKTGGAWTEAVLHAFSEADGVEPNAALILDPNGNLYGTTSAGGAFGFCPANGCGAAFELSPPAKTGGAWIETVLYRFGANSLDGENPEAPLVRKANGVLYGTTQFGGGANTACYLSSCGVVFELTPPTTTGGAWTETLLHSFSGADGENPTASVLKSDGNLYGTVDAGGVNQTCYGHSCGLVFELSPPATAGGNWNEKIIHDFNGVDGEEPTAAVIMDDKGDLYGTTYGDGASNDGTVFELTPPATANGKWTRRTLHDFGASAVDGEYPLAALVSDAKGHLYGTTQYGGVESGGAVFELTP